ncbi:hypothetical protein F511_22326 [Dorcoceras hygrometricum]|uniref:Uncharacterized protein n=1 Tax=Dorcoceras hygrometricum TaxID=472368 RepID=A0A2Z7A9P3_9LAMI|nr:hypothetical protein F511_22326 [Dorcoceras hygrometricum]
MEFRRRANGLEKGQIFEQLRSQDQFSAFSLSVFRLELTAYQVIFKQRTRSYQKSQETTWMRINEDQNQLWHNVQRDF